MCHGLSETLTLERFEEYFSIAEELGFYSINYNDLSRFLNQKEKLPGHPIMFDFDHPVKSIHDSIFPLMTKFGFKGNLFINTKNMEEMYAKGQQNDFDRLFMNWEEIKKLQKGGWHLGAHTHTHPNLSELSEKDPGGEAIRREMEINDCILLKKLGLQARDFAFTGTSWSSLAEKEAQKRYRFARLWIIDAMYMADGKPVRYADLVGIDGEDEADGGPPNTARYITKKLIHIKSPLWN